MAQKASALATDVLDELVLQRAFGLFRHAHLDTIEVLLLQLGQTLEILDRTFG